jgi:glyoxylase I family protein
VDAIDHLDLVVSDVEASLAFYRGLLRPLGYVREGVIAGERGERVTYLNRVARGGSLSLRQCQSSAHAVPYERYAIGVHHIAFSAASRAVVDERFQWLSAQGTKIESSPREYDYGPGYYAGFFYDPDGIKLEIVHHPADRDLVTAIQQLSQRVAELEAGSGNQ